MKRILKLMAALSILAWASSTEWPLMRCSRNNPDIDRCLLNAARGSVQKVFEGMPLYNLPSLEPMKLGKTSMSAKKGPVSIQITLEDAVLTGASKLQIDSAKYRHDIDQLRIGGLHKDIRLNGHYSMRGSIFSIPVNSEGTAEIMFKNVIADHLVQFSPRAKLDLHKSPKQRPIVQCYLDMKSIELMRFNMTAQGFGYFANRALNEVMNSNWRLLYSAFKPSVEDWLHTDYSKTMDSFFSSFDFDEILPERLIL
ncbi:Haemolymph juvenile hormone Hypothetical protein protein (JHBP) [Nesidiocoris tenuis]|uniref:Uncharacterized protein n=1 Tax=Nesidiocoris tenuis TaxID=355587 RepID=A0ABN7A5S3_9HEMI|nr:Haemolymph juvenile hormone Hypothetical protein protein (JHBP) [Nesidiocoris tenuis]